MVRPPWENTLNWGRRSRGTHQPTKTGAFCTRYCFAANTLGCLSASKSSMLIDWWRLADLKLHFHLCKDQNAEQRRTGSDHFFLDGWAIFARKMFRQRPKNCYANLQNCFDHTIIVNKIPNFGHFISSLDRMNLVFLRLINNFLFWLLLPENISVCPENGGFARLSLLPSPSLLARTPVVLRQDSVLKS